MGSTANIAGRVASQNIAGKKIIYPGVLGTAVAKLAGFNTISVVTVVDDKAHYYLGASSMIVKMVSDRETKKLLGLQVLGKGAVDKMVLICFKTV